MRRRLLGDDHIGVAITTSNLGVNLYQQGDLENAIRVLEDALQLFRSILGPDHQRALIAQSNLATIQSVAGDQAAAAALHRDILERRKRVYGPRHASVAHSMMLLANTLTRLGEVAETEQLLTDALAIQRETGARLDDQATTLRNLGEVLRRQNRVSDALARFTEAVGLMRAAGTDTTSEMSLMLAHQAAAHNRLGNRSAAERGFRDALNVATRALGPNHLRTLEFRIALAEFLASTERRAEARAHLPAIDSALTALKLPANHALRARAERVRTRSVS
jgi:tetratricopeptide (TPR) repeat protein